MAREKNLMYPWVILFILTLAQVFMSIGAYSWGPLAPFLREDLSISRMQIGLLTSMLYLASVIVATPSGFMVDKYGAKIMLIVCLITMGLPFVVMFWAKKYVFLSILSFLSGIGYGILNQASVKGIMHWFSTRQRGTAMGIKQAGVTVGGAISAVLLPFLAIQLSWRRAIVVVGILMILMALASILFYREQPSEELAIQKVTQKKEKAKFSQILKNPDLLLTFLIMPLLIGSQTCLSSFLILFLEEEVYYSSLVAGACLTSAMIAGTAGRVGWGMFSDRVLRGERIKALIIICLVAFLGSVGLLFLRPGMPQIIAFVFSVLMGAGFLGFHGVLLAFVAEVGGKELAGALTGVLITVSWVGIVIFPALFGMIADNFGYFWGWFSVALSSAFGTIGYFSSLLRKKYTLFYFK